MLRNILNLMILLVAVSLITGCAGNGGVFGEGSTKSDTGAEHAVSGGGLYNYKHTWVTPDGVEHECTVSSTSGREINGGTVEMSDRCEFTAGVNSATGNPEVMRLFRETLMLLRPPSP